MTSVQDLSADELTRVLAYAGFVLVGYELVKSMIVNPIKAFYAATKFADGMPFKTCEKDVLSRHRNELEASLLYLRDFIEGLTYGLSQNYASYCRCVGSQKLSNGKKKGKGNTKKRNKQGRVIQSISHRRVD